jgi:hypothetical protein
MRHLLLLLSLFCLLPMAACAPAPADRNWAYADLRLLDPAGDAPTSSTDLLAVYTRLASSDLEIRVDLLDISILPDYDLNLRIFTPAGDLTITVPADGRPEVNPANPNIVPRLVRDPWLDTVTVQINRLYISQPFTLQVTTFVPGSSTPADVTAPINSDGFPPMTRAPLLLAFWDTFPATTPAQALRCLDGAHSGPRGERHGLKHILANADLYGVPVALLDLKTPASLAALNQMSALLQIQNLSRRGLLLLPDVAYGEPADVSLLFSRRAAAGFGLPASQFVFNVSARFQSEYIAQFYRLDDMSHLSRSGGTRLIPLPATEAIQASVDGPSLDVRKALMDAALSTNSSDIVVLGGDLPRSTWGNENMAGPTFAWIAAHPWIQPLTGNDLLTIPVETSITPPETTPVASLLLETLQAAPDNVLTASAWQTYYMLTAPTGDEAIRSLRLNYLGQVHELLAAARWVERPFTQADCSRDLDGDGLPECVLSNQTFIASLDPAGARLTNLFYVDKTGPHQIIAPSSQFTVGLSDPSEWNLELGEAADPSVIPGAFGDDSETWTVYKPTITTNSITFSSPDGTRVKTYRLLVNGIEIDYQGSDPVHTRLPLAVDPQAFYFGPAEYNGSLTSGAWTWSQINGIKVEVRSQTALSALSFTDSLSYLSQPEDPDRLYPAGHYLPFPLSVVSMEGVRNFNVQIRVSSQ